MSDQRLGADNFNRRLWLSGGRDQGPEGSMRRCVGASAELTGSLVSRWGSTSLFPGIDAISLVKFNQDHYQYDGSTLYRNGVVWDTGYNGGRLTFTIAPPALGVPDYMFISGGGKLVKVDPSGNLTNWGIAPPVDGMVGAKGAQDVVSIDSFDGSAANWTASNCAKADEATIIYDGTGSLKVTPSAGPWSITKDLTATPLNLSVYADSVISLQTDLISFWLYMKKPTNVAWLWVLFDVNAGDFKTDYYRLVVQVIPQTANVHAANAAVILSADADRWVQIAAPKSLFTRIGGNLQYDWSTVKKIRIEGGDLTDTTAPPLYFDLFQLYGGYPLGTGPAALSGGSELDYMVTFGSNTTGNDSNPNPTPLKVNNVILQPVDLSRIPVSPDAQVDNRKLWRTVEGGGDFFYLDTIPDNTTTTYVDKISSLPGQPIVVTPWQKNVTITATQFAAPYYVDGGNGFYFKDTTNGTTGATIPTWLVPDTTWVSLGQFPTVGDTILPTKSTNLSAFRVSTAGKSGLLEPNWDSASAVGNTLTDGTVIWTNIGPLRTVDNTVTWTCQGLNVLRTLGTDVVKFDNIVFPSTMQDAVYHLGSMYGSRDTATGSKGFVYISPPGRAEGYGQILNVGTDDDPSQKLIVYDETVWLFTTKYIYPLKGVYPAVADDDRVIGAVGTRSPFSVVGSPYGIFYQTPEDIRVFNRARNEAVGFLALAPIERGQSAENIAPFTAVIAEHTRDEIWFSDTERTFAFSLTAGVWRMPGYAAKALYYDESDFGEIEASVGGNVIAAESSGALNDAGAAIPIEWQTQSWQLDPTQSTMTKRVYFDINCNGQVLTPTLLVDGTDYTLPLITNVARGKIMIPFQRSGLLVGVRLTGNVLARVEMFGTYIETSLSGKQSVGAAASISP